MAKERTLNASQAQELYGVNRSTIGRWIKAGALYAKEGRFFEGDLVKLIESSKSHKIKRKSSISTKAAPVLAETAKKTTQKRKSPTGKPPSPSTKRTPAKHKAAPPAKRSPSTDDGPGIEGLLKDSTDKYLVETALTREKLETARIKNARDRSELISRDLVRVILGQLWTIHVNELKPAGQKLAPELMAFAEIEDAVIEGKMAGLLDKEIHRILDHIKRKLMDFLKETRGEYHDPGEDEL